MTTIDNTFPYLNDRGDHYTTSSLIINDNLDLTLNKRLHVEGDIFVSGDIVSSVDIVSSGSVVINGASTIKGLQANKIKMLGRNIIEGDVMTQESGIFGVLSITGSLVSIGNLHLVSEVNITGDMGTTGNIDANSDIYVGGSIYVSGFFNLKGSLSTKNIMKINNTECSDFGRILKNDATLIFYGDSVSIKSKDGWTKNIEGITKIKESKEDCCEEIKQYKNLIIDDNIRNVIKNNILV